MHGEAKYKDWKMDEIVKDGLRAIFDTVPEDYLCVCDWRENQPNPDSDGKECRGCGRSMRIRTPQGNRLATLKFEYLTKAQKQHWRESMDGRLTTMKWVGASRKMILRAPLKRIRSDVTHRNENINDTANRIGSFIQTLTAEAKGYKRSLLQEHYGRIGTPLSSGAA